MTETIFVSDRGAGERREALRQARAYLYGGWEYGGWGSSPKSFAAGGTGFYFSRTTDGPDGFGAEQQLARLASGLIFGTRAENVASIHLTGRDGLA